MIKNLGIASFKHSFKILNGILLALFFVTIISCRLDDNKVFGGIGEDESSPPSPPATPVPTLFDVYVGSQGVSTSHILHYEFDTVLETMSHVNNISLTGAPITGSGLRGFTSMGNDFLVSSFPDGNTVWKFIDNSFSLDATFTLSGRSPELSDVIGLCQLSNGNIIAGSYGSGLVAEYDSLGNYIRDVFDTVYHMPDCFEKSSNVLMILDYDANSDEATIVRELSFGGGVWGPTASFALTNIGGSSVSAAWAFTPHTNGHLYIAPLHPGGGGTAKIVECLNMSLSACSEIGDDVPGVYPAGAVEGIAQIPNSDDMLYANHSGIFYYDLNNGQSTLLISHTGTTVDWIRHLIIRPK